VADHLNEKLFRQNVTNITFSFETSPNMKPKEKKVGVHDILCPPRLKKWGGHVPRVPHQIAPMPHTKTKAISKWKLKRTISIYKQTLKLSQTKTLQNRKEPLPLLITNIQTNSCPTLQKSFKTLGAPSGTRTTSTAAPPANSTPFKPCRSREHAVIRRLKIGNCLPLRCD